VIRYSFDEELLIMPHEIRFATFNLFNLAPAGATLYDNLVPLTEAQYDAKLNWCAQQLDALDADVIGFQEVFSQASLAEVLARTHGYRDAQCVGFDPDPALPRLTPSVALVSKLPLASPALAYRNFPDGVALPPGSRDSTAFTRPVLHLQIQLPDQHIVDVLVVHLKSRRPDYRSDDTGDPALLQAMAHLHALIRRGTEAVALRVLVSKLRHGGGRPCIVLGDFNDTLDSVTTSIVVGADGLPGDELAARMFDSSQIQLRQDDLRHLAYSCLHDGHAMTIDHILVSEEFHRASQRSIGEVLDVVYLNEHLQQARLDASDHGQVLARIRLYGSAIHDPADQV
jgi:endonuclease/exonuclease/phosphatase family metal-dependent hydrolase